MLEFISIGPTCNTATALKLNGFRLQSYPFDWNFTSLECIQHCYVDKFTKFLDTTNLYDIQENSSKHLFYNPMIKTKILLEHHRINNYYINEWNFFNHHNLLNLDIHSSFKKRCERFLNKVDNEKVCLVYMNNINHDYIDIIHFSKLFIHKSNVYILGLIKNDSKCLFYDQDNTLLYYYKDEEDIKSILSEVYTKKRLE
jgi:hypothetical protein